MAAINRNLLVVGAAILIIAAAAAAYTFSRPPPDTPGTNDQGGSGSSSPPTTTTTTTTPRTNSTKHGKGEVLYTFEAPIKVFVVDREISKSGKDYTLDEVEYYLYGYISWVPENPYLRYYEVTVNFNGNNLHAENRYASGDFQLWGKAAHPYIPYLRKEADIVALGPPEVEGLYKYYGGGYESSGTWWEKRDDGTEVWGPDVWPDGMHGWKCFTIHAVFNLANEVTIPAKVTVSEMEAIKAEMRQWMDEYTRGWTYTVRAMS